MSDASTKRMIDAHFEEAPPPGFLGSQTTRTHFHNSEKIEIDIERDDEDVAIVVTDMTAGARKNERSTYTSKEFTPPVFKEEATLNGFEGIKRQAGEHAYVDPNYQAAAIVRSFKVFRRLEWKLMRAYELMWSQVFQTGILSLTDASGNVLYTLDYGMKSAHKAVAGAAWSGLLSVATPLNHIVDRARVLTRNGKRKPNMLIFGTTAWRYFWQNTYVQALFGLNGGVKNLSVGEIRQQLGGFGDRMARAETSARNAIPQGRLAIEGFEFDLWVYDAEYKDPQTGNMVPYLDVNKVIMKHAQSRCDMAYGAVPILVPPEQRALPFLPARMAGAGLSLTTNAYVAPDNTAVTVGAYARPLPIPVAIDELGCIDTSS